MGNNKNQKRAVSTKSKPKRARTTPKMPCVCTEHYFDFDGSPLSPRINRYLGILPNTSRKRILTGSNLGISISSPQPGSTENNPVSASGAVTNDGRATVTAWLTDVNGAVTNGNVNYTNPPNWSAAFPNVTPGTYFLSAQAVMGNETACQTIQIIVQ